ncbi:metal ABC transporter substrate-binding protein, partial [bacterium AH-315-P07]|nr:metal ABC transporter substrate-binding protein [bacterium AH-315-P07]
MKKPIALSLLSIVLCATASAAPLKVVATLSTFGDLVKQIGGEHVSVSVIAPPTFNPHFIEPKPSDVLRVKKADLYVYSGLDLEVWSDPLLIAAANPKVRAGGAGHLKLSNGVRLLEVPRANVTRAEGDIHAYGNPHFWLAPDNVAQMAA